MSIWGYLLWALGLLGALGFMSRSRKRRRFVVFVAGSFLIALPFIFLAIVYDALSLFAIASQNPDHREFSKVRLFPYGVLFGGFCGIVIQSIRSCFCEK